MAALLPLNLIAPAQAAAQTLVGRVLEEGREFAVGGAVVTLVDASGEERASSIADSLGRYRIAPPEAGEYVVRAVRLGYEASTSPLLAMGVTGEVPFDLLLRPLPLGLGGFEVTVDRPAADAAELLKPFRLRPEELDERWISREELEKAPLSYDVGSIIFSQSIPGLYVRPSDTLSDDLCVQFRRVTVSGRGFDQCALTLLNGVLAPAGLIGNLLSDEIEAIVVLTPVEATQFYGTVAGGGAVLVWTRRGGGR